MDMKTPPPPPQFHCFGNGDYSLIWAKYQNHFVLLFSTQREFIRTLAIKPILKCNLCQIKDESIAQQFGPFCEGLPAQITWRFLQGMWRCVSLANASLGKSRTWANSGSFFFPLKETFLLHFLQSPVKNHKRILKGFRGSYCLQKLPQHQSSYDAIAWGWKRMEKLAEG